jgi:hypothetical protein
MAGRVKKWKKSAMAPILQVLKKKKWDFLGFPQSAQNSLLAKKIVSLTFVLLFCRQADTPNVTPSLVINNLTLS